ncbi:F-box protein At2g26160-like [Cornus florida]|uniref:F-box protein At2g26160-like n=1 Tax=Cornus florida TaxID=4283 RepID=UPI002897C585|nr:F-box protein At2g26160-like [Cornus florida]
MIVDKLDSLSDYVRFGAVCKPWQFVALENKVKFLERKCYAQVPLLMVPTKDNSEEFRILYNITRDKIYDFQLWVPYKKRCSGSSYGWLFTVEENMGVTLLNPFSGSTIELPSIMYVSKFEYHESDLEDIEVDIEYEYTPFDEPVLIEYQVHKAILSADPALSPNDCIVTAIYSDRHQLAFIRPSDKDWTYVEDERFNVIFDVIYYKGKVFAVDYWGGVLMIDVNSRGRASEAPQVKVIVPRIEVYAHRICLVESSSGDLYNVQRFHSEIGYDLQHETSNFKVFKLLLQPNENGMPERIEVKSLGGDAMFLGDSHSTCISTSKFPGCQPNSIYYIDDFFNFIVYPPYGYRDNGIFNVENGNFGTHYILDPSHMDMLPPIWILPTVVGN